jgi:CheY-like chemotaxis protein
MASMKMTVMIVEDDHDIRVTLREALEHEGYFVISVTNGASALELLAQTTPPDVILLDINMPIMNGDQFLAVIKTDPKLSKIPIIQMSAGTKQRRDGTCCSISKPVDLEEVFRLIETCRT